MLQFRTDAATKVRGQRRPVRRHSSRPLTVEWLEERTLLNHAPTGPVSVEVAFAEQGADVPDALAIRYAGPPGTVLRRIVIFFQGSSGEVRSDTAETPWGFGDACRGLEDCGPRVLADSGTGLTGASIVDGGDMIELAFGAGPENGARFDPGDEFVLGVDLDRTAPSGNWETRGSDIAGATLLGLVGGSVPPTLVSGPFIDAGGWSATARAAGSLPEQFPLTIITHGWIPGGRLAADQPCTRWPTPSRQPRPCTWPEKMADELLARGFHPEDLLVWTWPQTSAVPSAGWAEAEGEQLFGAVMERVLKDTGRTFTLHFIGHSRGAVVVSEAVNRVLRARAVDTALQGRITNVMTTYLDPHPARSGSPFHVRLGPVGHALGGLQDLMRDPDPAIWAGTGWADVYTQRNDAPSCDRPDDPLNLHGVIPKDPAYTEDVSRAGGVIICHTDVHAWYRRTMAQAEDWLTGWFFVTPAAILHRIFEGGIGPRQPLEFRSSLFNGSFSFTDDGRDGVALVRGVPGLDRLFIRAAPDAIPGFTSARVRFRNGNATLNPRAVLGHPRVFAPLGTTRLTFDVVSAPSHSGKLTLEIWVRDRVAAAGGQRPIFAKFLQDLRPGLVSVPLTPALDLSAGSVFDLEFRVTGRGRGSVTLDNLMLV